MSFLNALFLLALPIVAIPIALHFFRRRQREVVAWGAMQFLADAITPGRRVERIEQWLLMLLRTAALAALVLALAQPLVRGYWLGVAPTREVIVLLDDSLSTARDTGSGSLFASIQVASRGLIASLSESDRVQVMLTSAGPRWLTAEALSATSSHRRMLIEQIETLEPTAADSDAFSSLQAAVSSDTTSGLARRVVFITDGQSHGWQTSVPAAWRRLGAAVRDAKPPVSIEVTDVSVGGEPGVNLAVTQLKANRTLLSPQEQVRLSGEITNFGGQTARPGTLRWRVGNEMAGTTSVPALTPGASHTVEWTYAPPGTGTFAITCLLDAADLLPLDNEESVVVEVVDAIPILIVHPQADPENRKQPTDLKFLMTALGNDTGPASDADWISLFRPRLVTPAELESVVLAKFRAIVFARLSVLSGNQLDRIAEFVERGGGLWVCLTGRLDREAFNSAWYDGGAGLSPLPLAGIVDSSQQPDREIHIHPPTSDHPTTIQLSDTEHLDLDAVRIQRHYRFDTSAAAEVSVLLETDAGHPLAVENYVGRGRAIFQTLSSDIGWSTLPLTRAYVVMVDDWLSYLTQPAATRFNLPAGTPLEFVRPQDLADANVQLVVRGSEPIDIVPHDYDGGAMFRYGQTELPGSYQLRFATGSAAERIVPFQVQRERAESDLTPLAKAERTMLTDATGMQFANEIEAYPSDLPQAPNEKPLWWILLSTLLLLIAAELLLTARIAGQRPTDVLAATGI